MKCPCCGAAELIQDTRDIDYTYKGQTTVIKQVEGLYCPSCGESLTGPEETERTMRLMNEFIKQVNAATDIPRFIQHARKLLNLEQKEAGEIFGGGVNAFSRYETGKASPPKSLLLLLALLEKKPTLLNELKTLQASQSTGKKATTQEAA